MHYTVSLMYYRSKDMLTVLNILDWDKYVKYSLKSNRMDRVGRTFLSSVQSTYQIACL